MCTAVSHSVISVISSLCWSISSARLCRCNPGMQPLAPRSDLSVGISADSYMQGPAHITTVPPNTPNLQQFAQLVTPAPLIKHVGSHSPGVWLPAAPVCAP